MPWRPRSTVRNSRGRGPWFGIISVVYDSPRTNNNLVGVYSGFIPPREYVAEGLPGQASTHCINNEWRQPNFHCYIISYGLHTPRPLLCPASSTRFTHTRVKTAPRTSFPSKSTLLRKERDRERERERDHPLPL